MPLAPLADPWADPTKVDGLPLKDAEVFLDLVLRFLFLSYAITGIYYLFKTPFNYFNIMSGCCVMQMPSVSETSDELSGENEKDTTAEIEVTDITRAGHAKADPSQFELLKVLGQGSFGKVPSTTLSYCGFVSLAFCFAGFSRSKNHR